MIPLHYAAGSGTPENIQALLKAGSDVMARSEEGWTPLHSAAGSGIPESIQVIEKMKLTLTALTVAATLFASSASAFDPDDLQNPLRKADGGDGGGLTGGYPLTSYVIEESNTVIGATNSEVALQFSPISVTMGNQSEMRNFRFIKK